MADILKHGEHYRVFQCECGCKFGTSECLVACKKGSKEVDHVSANCPECGRNCINKVPA